MKTLGRVDFAQDPRIPATKIRELAEGAYIERKQPVVLIGECGHRQKSSGNRTLPRRLPAEKARGFTTGLR